jgi:cation diffusion facilitator CzcD-associated flavoprotein CzcO
MAQRRLSKLSSQLQGGSVPTEPDEGSSASSTTGTYAVHEQPLGSTRHLRIVCIGAGASGLNMIRALRVHLKDYELVVYEKNAKIGGTWHENRYPGCKCDIPSHNYQFSWSPNPGWSGFFSPAEEIDEYLDNICEREGMHSSIKTQHSIDQAKWDEEKGIYQLKGKNLGTGEKFEDYCNFLLDASGILK